MKGGGDQSLWREEKKTQKTEGIHGWFKDANVYALQIFTQSQGCMNSFFPATLLVESSVLLKHMGKYHIVCEKQRGTSLKICNLDSIPGLATDSC